MTSLSLCWAVQDASASVDRMAQDVMPRPVEVRALEPYRIWLRYDDGVEGEVDLSPSGPARASSLRGRIQRSSLASTSAPSAASAGARESTCARTPCTCASQARSTSGVDA